ncbi:hypothetical protein BOQ60_26235, partial [Chryseobacterium sp. CH1]
MTVYNTATNTSVAANPVYPGEYYNDGTQWQRNSPRVALVATNNSAPLTSHVAGMTVYNTATNTSVAANPVYPGEYYNDGTQWQRNS